MLQRIVNSLKGVFEQLPILIPTTNRNVVIITMFPKKGIVTLSYKGETRRALLEDNSLRNMMHNNDYDKNSLKVFQTAAMLLSSLIEK